MVSSWPQFLPGQKQLRLIFLFMGGAFLTARHGSEAMVLLQENGIASALSGLTWDKTLPSLRSFTYCVRLYSFRSRYSDYFFSYATEDQDNELAFHLKYGKKELRLACCTKRVFHIIHLDVAQLKWLSFCAAVNFTSATATFIHTYGEDQRDIHDTRKDSPYPLMVQGGGVVILGQDQDEPGGGTDKGQSFNGYMSDLYLTTDVLTKQEMTSYVQCDNEPLSNHLHLMNFNNIESSFKLGESTIEIDDVDSCAISKFYSIFTEGRTFKDANQFCSILNGRVALPLDQEDNKVLYDAGSKSAEKCTNFDKANGIWVAVIWDHKLNIWKNMVTQKRALFKNFEPEITPISDTVLCVIAQTLSEPPAIDPVGNWDIESCQRSVCTACEFESPRPLKIRGLCAESVFDKDYYVYDKINLRPVFNGKSWTRIAWNNSQSAYDYSWVMYQIAEPSVQARMVTKSELDYPVGVHDFEVIGDKCPERQIKLKLTSCTNGMYTCNDGACIGIEKRCNLELDCADNSDELDCATLVLPSGYEKRLPPPKKDASTPAEINIDFTIRVIREFNLLESNMVVDVVIMRSWYDTRVQYKNLHDTNNLNLIDDLVAMIWYPEVTLLGAENSIARFEMLSTTAWGERLTGPEPDDDQLLDEDVYYSGNGNPLALEREMSVTFMCTFDLSLYPFDSQRCSLIFYVGAYTQSYVTTKLRKVEFSGTRRLLEYQVTSIGNEPLLYQNKSGQQIYLVLTNLYGYYISGAYVPTLLLVIISYMTFFFSLEDFTNRVMVSLTSLLVLAALFSQIASGLPKTAYMKLIDIWFIFCILSDFVMVMLLVIINTIIDKQNSKTKISVFSSREIKLKGKVPIARGCLILNPRKCNSMAQMVLPVFMGLFIIIYFGSVAYHMSKVTGTL